MSKNARPEPAVGQVWRYQGVEYTLQRHWSEMRSWYCKDGGFIYDDVFVCPALEYVRGPEASGPEMWKVGQRRKIRCMDSGALYVGVLVPPHPSRGYDFGLKCDGMTVCVRQCWPSELIQDIGGPEVAEPVLHAVLGCVTLCGATDGGETWDHSKATCPECIAKRVVVVRPCCGLAASDCECPKALVQAGPAQAAFLRGDKSPPKLSQAHEANLIAHDGVCGQSTGDPTMPMCWMHKGHGLPCVERMRAAISRGEKPHRFDRYCVLTYGYANRHQVLACVDCGQPGDTGECKPRPGWREDLERMMAQDAADRADRLRLKPEPPTRYDARQLLAPVGLGPGELVCPVRGKRGPR